VTPIDREHLKEWYRDAMRRRVAELEALRPGLQAGSGEAVARTRQIAHALQGSGGSFGFPHVSDVGALLEGAPPEALARKVEGVLRVLRAVAWPDDPVEQRPHAWLAAVVPGLPEAGGTLQQAWERAATLEGASLEDVASLVAAHYGVQGPEPLHPSAGVRRLVPEAWATDRGVLPLDEDGTLLRLATSDPVDVLTELEIRRVAGRSPLFVVVPPNALEEAWRAATPTAGPTAASGTASDLVPAQCPVLLVDDDPGARVIAKAVLERKGFPVVDAPDGEGALEAYMRRADIRLAVVDLEMPGMGGRELVRRLREADTARALGIVVLTGSKDAELEAELIEGGADDYIQKPLDPRLFLARVSATLRRSLALSPRDAPRP